MNGIINILKPPGMTSSDVVVDVRRALGIKKVGHAGTLDPAAAGALPVCVGKATRLFDYLTDKDKEYLFEMRFGYETDTLDAQGSVVSASDVRVGAQELKDTLVQFIGRQNQTPPAYSALKIGGKKMYELARKGVDVSAQKQQREIEIHELSFVEQTGEDRFMLRVNCSRGTYVRSLCADIAHALGAMAYVSFLLRTRAGIFSLADSHSLDELRKAAGEGCAHELLTPMDCALGHLDAVNVSEKQGEELKNGCIVFMPQEVDPGCLLRVYSQDVFLGIGRFEGRALKMSKLLIV